MTHVILAILAIAKAVPIVDKWVSQLKTFAEKLLLIHRIHEYANAKKENREAVTAMLKTGDVRSVEKLMGNPYAGKPDPTVPGTDIGSLPGM